MYRVGQLRGREILEVTGIDICTLGNKTKKQVYYQVVEARPGAHPEVLGGKQQAGRLLILGQVRGDLFVQFTKANP